MGIFGRSKSEEDGFTSYYKCNGMIEVHVAEDGTEVFKLPRSFKWVETEEEDAVSCPYCGEEEIYYHRGEYICINCESTFTEEELAEHCGCDIIHG